LTDPSGADGIVRTGTGRSVTSPPSYIFSSTRTRRRSGQWGAGPGPGLLFVAAVLLAFWAAVGVAAAALFGAL
jgi:hypothetical protein